MAQRDNPSGHGENRNSFVNGRHPHLATLFRDIVCGLDYETGEAVSFACSGVAVTFKTNIKGVLDWLLSYFHGYFFPCRAIPSDAAVYAIISKQCFDIVLRSGCMERLALDENGSAIVQVTSNVDLVLQLCGEDAPGVFSATFLDRERRDVLIVLPEDFAGMERIPMRVVRAFIILLLAEKGWSYVHCGCLVSNGIGIGLVGPKGAGKTTTLLNVLLGNKYGFLANDKVAMQAKGAGIEVLGFPIASGVRVGTLLALPRLRSSLVGPVDRGKERCGGETDDWMHQLPRLQDEKESVRRVHVTPVELCARLNVKVVPNTLLRVLIEPRYELGRERPHLTEMSSAQARRCLQRQYLTTLTERQAFLDSLVTIDKAQMQRRFSALVDHMQRSVVFYRLYQSEKTNDQVLELCQEVINRLPSRKTESENENNGQPRF